MSNSQLWLDLFISPNRIIHRYFQTHPSHSERITAGRLKRFLVNTNRFGKSHDQQDLLKWIGQPMQGFIPYPDLPVQLREINNPPAGLLFQGKSELLHKRMIAVIGSRKQTPAGAENCRQFAYQLSQAGLVIISGLAAGADKSAHESALTSGGNTVAVLGQGLAHYYPPRNKELQDRIRAEGLLVSEYLPSQAVKSWQFPHRNRLISALSEGVVVSEAARISGSLITANLAAEQGRQVFAIPGDIQNPMVSGCHHLIREGAQLVSHPREILQAIYWTEPQQLALVTAHKEQDQLSDSEKKVLRALDRTPRHLDIILARTECELTLVLDALFSLELKSMIISSIDGYYKPNQGDTC